MPRIAWIDESAAEGQLAEIYEKLRSNDARGRIPDIFRTMSHRPDFLDAVLKASQLHFTDGALSRAQHEMIALYVSALNRCHY